MSKLGHPIFALIGLEVKEVTNWGPGCTVRFEGKTTDGKAVSVKFDLPVNDPIATIDDAMYAVAVEYIGQKEDK
jgi:hypothetical protein